MSASVRAVVFPGDDTYEVRELPMPEPPAGGALLKVEAVGLCGSDVAQIGGDTIVPGATFPVVPGHETVGRVEALGSGSDALGVAEGDLVAVDEVLRCGECTACKRGEPMCADLQVYGYTMGVDEGPGLWGGCGEYLVIRPGTRLHRLPDDVPPAELTVFEPLASAVHWVELAGVGLGDTVVIEGPGHQGLACLVVALAAGAGEVIVTGTAEDGLRLDSARRLGAHHTVVVDEVDPVSAVREITDGRMADVAMDVAAGTTATVTAAIDMVRFHGTVLLAGLKHFAPLDGLITDMVVLRGVRIQGGPGFTPESMSTAVGMIRAGQIPTGEMRGEVFPLDRVDEAMRLLRREEPGRDAVRVSLQMS